MAPETVIGFDFGTSNSAIAVAAPGALPRLLSLDRARPGSTLVPSTLYFRPDGTLHIGQDAIETFARLEAGRTIRRQQQATGEEIETAFGRERVLTQVDVNQPGRLFQSIKRSLADATFRGTDVFGRFSTMEDLVAAFASEMRRRAEEQLGRPVRVAMVGRPVHWSTTPAGDALALARMERALRQAGFDAFAFTEEPIAAGLRWAAGLTVPRTVLVFDFGGGTLDVTVMRVGGAERTVLSTAGIPIGGDVLDEDVMDQRLLSYFGEHVRWSGQRLPMPQHILDTVRRWHTIPELNEPGTLRFLHQLEREPDESVRRQARALLSLARGNHGWPIYREIERAKISLSDRERERIRYHADAIAVDEPLARTEFEGVIAARVRQASACVDDALAASGLRAEQVDAVMQTGGSSLIPRFRRLLADRFGEERLRSEDAFTSVASGLALAAADLEGGRVD
ncbi:MAG TPA: Hsp70 family protein [Thermomicrobiaceae bacterium]|nr:Hsp70 family protein [Thermomicrobiaceae bacterium]